MASPSVAPQLALESGNVSLYIRGTDAGPDYPLCRLYHRRGPLRQGTPPPAGPDQLPNFYHAVSNVTLTTKKVRQLFGRSKVHLERENSGYAYEKRAPALRWYGPPEWLIRPRTDGWINFAKNPVAEY